MIFVTLGTQDKVFNRLLEAIDKEIEKGNIKEKVVVQAGCTKYESKNMEVLDLVPQDEFEKTDEFELCIHEFINGILTAAGIKDTATFKRSQIVNRKEETEMLLLASEYLDDETILRKLPFLTEDEIEGILQRKDAEEVNRFKPITKTNDKQPAIIFNKSLFLKNIVILINNIHNIKEITIGNIGNINITGTINK